jgi:ribosomal protein L40E
MARKHSVQIDVKASESTVFTYCVSTMNANGLRHHANFELGIIAVPDAPGFFGSYGVDLKVIVTPPNNSPITTVLIVAESKRSCLTLGVPTLGELLSESKTVADNFINTFTIMLKRNNVEFNVFVEEENKQDEKIEPRKQVKEYGVQVLVCPKCGTLNSLSFTKCTECQTNLDKVSPIPNPRL